MPVTAFNGNGLVSKLEILRGDLVDVLYQATKDTTEYRFDTRIENSSRATTASRRRCPTDHKSRRTSSWAPTARIPRCGVWCSGPRSSSSNRLGGYNAWFSAPDSVGLDGWYLMYQAPGV